MKKKIIVSFLVFMLFLTLPMEASAKTYTTKEQVYNIIKKNLLAHKVKFTITTDMDVMNEIGRNADMFSAVAALDDKKTSKDGDYLNLSISSWRTNWQWSSQGDTAELTFSAVYRTTLKQEKAVDEKIAGILDSLNLENKTEYQKVKAIHDYIIKKTSYDQSLEKHSAYDALINKSAVCEGYALAAYRLFTEAGIKCRIITGYAGGAAHAWNIVSVNGKWYNIDLTWDDPITNTGKPMLSYDYFLKNAKDFSDHTRDNEYNTSAFLKKYPIAKENYKMK